MEAFFARLKKKNAPRWGLKEWGTIFLVGGFYFGFLYFLLSGAEEYAPRRERVVEVTDDRSSDDSSYDPTSSSTSESNGPDIDWTFGSDPDRPPTGSYGPF